MSDLCMSDPIERSK